MAAAPPKQRLTSAGSAAAPADCASYPPISPNRERTLSMSLADPHSLLHGGGTADRHHGRHGSHHRHHDPSPYEPLALRSPPATGQFNTAFPFPASPTAVQFVPIMTLPGTGPAAAACMISPPALAVMVGGGVGGLQSAGFWQQQPAVQQHYHGGQLVLETSPHARRHHSSQASPPTLQPARSWWEAGWQG